MTKANSPTLAESKIVITGGAGLVGQNLLVKLLAGGIENLCVIDKSAHNLAIATELHPAVHFIGADLSEPGPWQSAVAEADIVVMLHAQIGGNVAENFHRNNVTATEHILSNIRRDAYLVHVSSSVLESSASDDYTLSKTRQEQLVLASGLSYSLLRPTLMFGWFDRKHFGWLSQFMSSTPLFPIPGDGNFIRQPLYAGDFCDIIVACMEQQLPDQSFNISGKEKAYYIDIIRQIKGATGSNSRLVKLPYWLFYALLAVYGIFDRNPPFTTSQLKALVIDEVFEDIDWERVFGVTATPLKQAIQQTFTHSVYSKIKLKF